MIILGISQSIKVRSNAFVYFLAFHVSFPEADVVLLENLSVTLIIVLLPNIKNSGKERKKAKNDKERKHERRFLSFCLLCVCVYDE